MSGRAEISSDERELTLSRETRRQSSPMGGFSAVYSGTNTPVDGLTGFNCGETLLGIPREIFERSAFIRQAGLGVTPDAELERRIVALITSGEEDTSYTEAAESLKKQLNRRRHNKTGQIPVLESELDAVKQRLALLQEQQARLTQLRKQIALETERQTELQRQLALWDR